jgi:hypothetical protein
MVNSATRLGTSRPNSRHQPSLFRPPHRRSPTASRTATRERHETPIECIKPSFHSIVQRGDHRSKSASIATIVRLLFVMSSFALTDRNQPFYRYS